MSSGIVPGMMPAPAALEALREGNRRFVRELGGGEMISRKRRRLPATQDPLAIVLGCSDARAPPEILFDQDLGDLFVIRVAGNVVAPTILGSIEFAVEAFGTQLVVVLGHTGCGGVRATLAQLTRAAPEPSANLRSIVDRVRPAVEGLGVAAGRDPRELEEQAVRANIRLAASQLRGSEVLAALICTGGVRVVGAEYSLETGVVDFFDGVPVAD